MRREGGALLLGPLLLLAMLRDARAQDYCVDHYWVPGTGVRGTSEESCQSMHPKDGWCGESASNCEGGCGGVWCTHASTDTSSDATAPPASFVGCWSENLIPGWTPYSCDDGATTYYTGCSRMSGTHSERVAQCAQLCAELGYNQFDIHDSSACFCGAVSNVASTPPTDETEIEAIAAGCMNFVYTIASPCVDIDNGLMGRFSYTCASIGDNLDKCTGYDANGFVAGDMCCQCGGGAVQLHVLPSHALRFGQGVVSEYELQLESLGEAAVDLSTAGVWTLSAWAMYTSDYDGCQKLLHSRWWSGTTILGTTGNSCEGQIGWPSTADTWEWVSETFDTQGVVPSRMIWFVGYPQDNTAGNSYITDLQLTGPDGSTWINDGTFDGGSHMSHWSQVASRGAYSIVSTPQRGCPSCVVCPAGKYSGVTGCSLCPAGFVTDTLDQPGATTCAACPRGRYSQSPQLACRECSTGSFTDTLDQPGATNCSVCPVGQYSSSPYQSCQQCPTGQYNDAPNRTNCTVCRGGGVTNTQDRPGATRCDTKCDGKVHCEWIDGPARFLCVFGPSLAHEDYQAVLPREFDLVGDAYNDGNTTLVLTTTQADQMGLARYRLPTPPRWLTGVFTVRFEMYIGDGNGADGMCVNLGDPSPHEVAEDGVATGVSLCFDEFPNGDFENGVDLYVNGVVVWEERAECTYGDCHPMTLFEDARWHSVEMTTSPDATGGMTVAFELDGGALNGTAHVDDFEPPPDQDSWLMFSARTGALTNNHWVRNVTIREGGAALSYTDVPSGATVEEHQLTLRSFVSPACSAASGPTGTTGGDMQPPKLGVAFSSGFLCEVSRAHSRTVVHAPPDLRAVGRVVKREHLEGLDGLPDAMAAKRLGLSLQCYERVVAAMNMGVFEVPLATLQEFEYVGCGEDQAEAQGTETCIPPDYMPDGPESAYWVAILSSQSCLSTSMCNENAAGQDQCRMIVGRDAVGCADLEGTDWMPDPCINAEQQVCDAYGVGTDNAPCCEWMTAPCAEALERLRAKFAGCPGVEHL